MGFNSGFKGLKKPSYRQLRLHISTEKLSNFRMNFIYYIFHIITWKLVIFKTQHNHRHFLYIAQVGFGVSWIISRHVSLMTLVAPLILRLNQSKERGCEEWATILTFGQGKKTNGHKSCGWADRENDLSLPNICLGRHDWSPLYTSPHFLFWEKVIYTIIDTFSMLKRCGREGVYLLQNPGLPCSFRFLYAFYPEKAFLIKLQQFI